MSLRCVALFSGGLDSMLAIRLMQDQGIEVEALNFQTIFTCCRDRAGEAARQLGVRLTVTEPDGDYLQLIRKPRFGYGRGANPCVDCRISMFQAARRFMHQVGAKLVVSGEVVGQRPMSQKRRDLEVIARHSGLEDRLLRPLSARLLPATRPEKEGLVDRQRLMGFSGRGRKPMIALARQFGFSDIPGSSTGCALTEVGFSHKVFDLMESDPDSRGWDFQLLPIGRHFRLDDETKIIVGRNAEDNAKLRYLFELPEARRATLLQPHAFAGPAVMIIGPSNDRTWDEAVALMLQHTRRIDSQRGRIRINHGADAWSIELPPAAPPSSARNVTDRTSTQTGRRAQPPSSSWPGSSADGQKTPRSTTFGSRIRSTDRGQFHL